MVKGYLNSFIKEECYGCEACMQICPTNAISMEEDEEGFRYPKIDDTKCIHCNKCRAVCPASNPIFKHNNKQKCYGGYVNDSDVLQKSTSGGIFSALVEAYCDANYVIFGAESVGLSVFHSFILDKKNLDKYRKSKYSQSIIGNSYVNVKKFLCEGKKVLFSGTPCQISGLYNYLGDIDSTNLLTVEVICHGLPSPLYMRKYNSYLIQKNKSGMKMVDYRNKDNPKKWDFETLKIVLDNDKEIKADRWYSPYWKLWLSNLMSRPSCYSCDFSTITRCADITLGDLWGVHLYCPELYNSNKGSSLIIANTEKGTKIVEKSMNYCHLKSLDINEAIKYQVSLRKHIDKNSNRYFFMKDLKNDSISYIELNRRWYKCNRLLVFLDKYFINRIIKKRNILFAKK